MSSILAGSLPTKNGFKYRSTAVWTTRARWVKVAQPNPYSPAWLVNTFTTTSLMPAGAVRIVLTSVIFNLSFDCSGTSAISPICELPKVQPAVAADNADAANQSRRFMPLTS
jgi:hypothetical protein